MLTITWNHIDSQATLPVTEEQSQFTGLMGLTSVIGLPEECTARIKLSPRCLPSRAPAASDTSVGASYPPSHERPRP